MWSSLTASAGSVRGRAGSRRKVKVRVCYSEDFPENFRQAIRRHYGKTGLATRQECKDWARQFGNSMDDEMSQLADQPEDATPERVW
jgi:hypothetical protein